MMVKRGRRREANYEEIRPTGRPFQSVVMPNQTVESAKLGLMGVRHNLQMPLTPDGTTSRSIKDYHRPFWPEVLLFPATVNTDE